MMERKEFLRNICVFAALKPLDSCAAMLKVHKETGNEVNFTIDLTDQTYQKLAKKGSYQVVNEVVIAHLNNGNYAAATVICSHMQQKKITYDKNINEWHCKGHGATYSLNGKGTNEHGKNGLLIYQVELNGNLLRVFSKT